MSDTRHQFTPIVTVTLREDGRYEVEFDWTDSYQGGYTGDDIDLDYKPESEAVIDAVDQWINRQPSSLIIGNK